MKRDENSSKGWKLKWKEVKSGIPQGSVLASIIFLVDVNDMTEEISSYISLFVNDAKDKKPLRLWRATEWYK